MGWLKELMRIAEPPIDGYGELSRAALSHPEWPEHTQPQPRSLAALFSKLDRNLELEWLEDRPAVQRCLSLVLRAPLSAIQAPLRSASDVASATGRLRLDDLPFARPLSLSEEDLPPGLPPAVTRPAGWDRCWWVAPAGSGRSLVARWLAARGRAETLVLDRYRAEALPEAYRPDAGGTSPPDRHGMPLYLEVERPEGLEALWRRPPRGPVCVAAPLAPVEASPFAVVESPPAADVLDELAAWVESRLPEDGSFHAASAAEWLRPRVAAGTLRTLGALLGACGLLDSVGVARARDRSLDELAEELVGERLEGASSQGSTEARWLRQFGFEVLVKLAQAALSADDAPWDAPRTHDEWIALVPAELQQSVDADWVRWSLSRSAGQTTVRELERALESTPPGAYRIIRALTEAGLLRSRSSTGRLGVAPDLLREVTRVRARRLLVDDGSPFGWGEALLRPHAANEIAEVVFERLDHEEFGLVESLLELDVATHPALVVATEACFLGLGLRALAGADVPEEYLTPIWNEQMALLVELPGQPPAPRLLRLDEPPAPGQSGAAPHCARRQSAPFRLAALALSERLAESEGAPHPILRPWTARDAPTALLETLDDIYAAALAQGPAQRWPVDAFSLAGRLRAQGLLGDGDAPPHPLSRPTALVDGLLSDRLSWSDVAGLGAHAVELSALRGECELQRVPWPRMARALWDAFERAGRPDDGDLLLAPDAPAHAALWPYLPEDRAAAMLVRYRDRASAWPLSLLGARHWQALVSALPSDRWGDALADSWARIVEALPPTWAQELAGADTLFELPQPRSTELLSIIWRRFPALLLSRLDPARELSAVALSHLLPATPDEHVASVVAALGERMARRSTTLADLDAARVWLSGSVRRRSPGWRGAYALLHQLEERVARTRRASGRPRG